MIRSSTSTRGRTLPRPGRFSRLRGFAGLVALSMPLGLMSGRPFSPFSRAISSRCSLTTCFSAAISSMKPATTASSFGRLSADRLGGVLTHSVNRTPPRRSKEIMRPRPGFCPYYAQLSQPDPGSVDADIARASQLQHAIEDIDGHVHFSCPTFVHTGAQPVADHLFPSPDRRLYLGPPIVAGGFLPSHAALLGDALEMTVALCRRGRGHFARHCSAARRHNHRGFRVTVSDAGVNAVLIIRPIADERGQRTHDLVKRRAGLSAIVHVFVGQ